MKNLVTASRLKIGAVGLAGLVAGGVLAGTLSATAANNDSSTPEATAPDGGSGRFMGEPGDPSQPMRDDEEQLGPGGFGGPGGHPGDHHGHGMPGGQPPTGWDDELEGGDTT